MPSFATLVQEFNRSSIMKRLTDEMRRLEREFSAFCDENVSDMSVISIQIFTRVRAVYGYKDRDFKLRNVPKLTKTGILRANYVRSEMA